jgi:hypothetical protein
MRGLWDWPALAGVASLGLPRRLAVEQGVWGKVHGARSDFRWIAATRGFAFLGENLERELAVGIEDRPVRFPLWRAHSGVHFGGICYPSRARDAAGRGGALEKQLLAWRTDRGIPAVLAALLLLPRVAELDDGAWWGRADASSWDVDPRFVLNLGGPRDLPVSEGALEETVTAGIFSLRETLATDSAEAILADLFNGLLEGRRPVLLAVHEEPLTPEALAVLLLPLDRERADALSLAGWLPSSRPFRQDLGESWDLVALPGPPERTRSRPSADPRARRMAAALLAGDPSLLAGIRAPERAPAPSRARRTVGEATMEVGPRRPPATRPEGTGRPSFPSPPTLSEPAAETGRGWRLLYEFSRDPCRFWLDPRDFAPYLGDPSRGGDGGGLQAALTWLGILASSRPSDPAGDQHRTKGDLLRAAILALSPTAATFDAVGSFLSGRVPPVLYLAALSPRAWERTRRAFGEVRIAELIRQSREHCAPELRTRLDHWIERRTAGINADAVGAPRWRGGGE